MFEVEKWYDHSEGLSCCFRQPTATSHCRLFHGYPLAFGFRIMSETLDARNWVADFGGFKGVKQWLKDNFDHTLAVAANDPELQFIQQIGERGLADVRVFSAVGCEAFSKIAAEAARFILERDPNWNPSAFLYSCTVAEHSANRARYVFPDAYQRVIKHGV